MNSKNTETLSILSLIFGILSIVICCARVPLGCIGLILGIASLSMNKPGRSQAIAGIVMSSISLLIGLWLIVAGIVSAIKGNTHFYIYNNMFPGGNNDSIFEYYEDGLPEWSQWL